MHTASLVTEKVQQAIGILAETGADAWLTFVRETSAGTDPVLPLIFGPETLTWQSVLLLTADGRRSAIVGRFEADAVRRKGLYDTVIPYDEALRPILLEALARLDPRQIAINTSTDDVYADGLTHGMYQLLTGYLASTPYAGRLVSAERIIARLRSRKTPAEVARIRAAVETTRLIFERAFAFIRPGRTEREVSEFMHQQMAELGVGAAWDYDGCPAVNSGPDSPVGHGAPGEIVLAPGHIVHMDFGVRQDSYCSDIQRVIYLLRPGESEPPAPVRRGFATVRAAVEAAIAAMRPGVTGLEVDAAARGIVTGAGYPEYKYATGHGLGRNAHDGGPLLGPLWERYGDTPRQLLEAGHVYTVEPGLAVPGYGYIGLEEDVLVTDAGAVYLGEPQREMWVKR
jgi:Xaa-Pro aminopeptidase